VHKVKGETCVETHTVLSDFTKNWHILTLLLELCSVEFPKNPWWFLAYMQRAERHTLQLFVLNALKKKECNIGLKCLAQFMKTGGNVNHMTALVTLHILLNTIEIQGWQAVGRPLISVAMRQTC
jgi:hypothetical protein